MKQFDVTKYNPVLDRFSVNSRESYPIGTGDCGANVFMTEDGTLHLLLSKTDTFAESGRLMKLGYLKISYETPVFTSDNPPVLTLHLDSGTVVIRDRAETAELTIAAFVNRPLYGVRSRTAEPNRIRVTQFNYRKEKRELLRTDESAQMYLKGPFPVFESADIVTNPENTLAWCHHNQWSYYAYTVVNQHLTRIMRTDPILYRTFGCAVAGIGFTEENGVLTGERSTASEFYIAAACEICLDGEAWNLAQSRALCAALDSYDFDALLEANRAWWTNYFTEYYVHVYGTEEAEEVTRGYTLQKYLLGCAGHGVYPVKFNGSLFTMHPSPYYKDDYDYRRWGDPYWTQNTRLIYWDMLYSGDFDGVRRYFDFMLSVMPEAMEHAKNRFGCGGMNLPETFSFYGTYTDRCFGFGNDMEEHPVMPNLYLRWHFNGQLEISYMMLKFREMTGGAYDAYFREKLVPFIQEAIRFFEEHFPTYNGKLHLYPVGSLETWQNCVNDAPNIAGLRAVCRALHRAGIEPCIDESKIPELPEEDRGGHHVLAPCEAYVEEAAHNFETPELYALFPYDLFNFKMTDAEYALVSETFEQAHETFTNSWSQRLEFGAMLGKKEYCRDTVLANFRNTCPECTFKGFFGPNFDWVPDQDHGTTTSIGLLLMLLQTHEGENAFFRGLPEEWKADIRLPSCKGTVEASTEAELSAKE